jgi:hypothetical protein
MRPITAILLGFLFCHAAIAAEHCGAFFQSATAKSSFQALPLLSVENLPTEQPFRLPSNAPATTSMIVCERETIIPSKNDYKVLETGLVLGIVAADGRRGVVERVGGRLRLNVLNGNLTDAESNQISKVLNAPQQQDSTAPDVAP